MTTVAVACEERLSLRPGVYLATVAGQLLLFRRQIWSHEEALGASDDVKRDVLRRLADGSWTADELLALGEDVAELLGVLQAGGWLVRTVRWQDRDLYRLLPSNAWRVHTREAPDGPLGELVLSRFAVLRREGERFVVESPLARAQLEICDPEVAALVTRLVRPLPDDTTTTLPGGVREQILRDLAKAGLIVRETDEAEPATRLWRPHEMVFHARSRMGDGGHFGTGFGRTNWAELRGEPVPDEPEPGPGPFVDLYRPDLEALRFSDRPLTAVMEERRSIRTHDDSAPITVEGLGELLYRCASVRTRVTEEGVEYPGRPYPGGGGAYELELYPVVRDVAGLAAGMYHYDPREHRLELVREPGPHTTRLLKAAMRGALMKAQPQLVIVVSARFGRMMYRYEEMPYSVILKHVGVLYQTIYLVATSMGLAACALGGGDAMAFTEATGLDYTTESSVGEFVLGSRPATGAIPED